MNIGPTTDQAERFQELLGDVGGGDVLELGTMRWDEAKPTHHGHWLDGFEHVKADVLDGLDVDVVVDAHELAERFDEARFSAAIADAVWEHLVEPWRAADQLAAVCRPGAPIYVSTHQTFPIHGYPDDYFRFSDRALASLFENEHWITVEAGYAFPCRIVPPPEVTVWNAAAPAFLNVELCAVRSETPWTRRY